MRMTLEKFIEQSLKRAPTNLGEGRFELKEEEDYFLFIDRDYEGSEDVIASDPVCGFLVGMLHYSMEWNGLLDTCTTWKRSSAEPWGTLLT